MLEQNRSLTGPPTAGPRVQPRLRHTFQMRSHGAFEVFARFLGPLRYRLCQDKPSVTAQLVPRNERAT